MCFLLASKLYFTVAGVDQIVIGPNIERIDASVEAAFTDDDRAIVLICLADLKLKVATRKILVEGFVGDHRLSCLLALARLARHDRHLTVSLAVGRDGKAHLPLCQVIFTPKDKKRGRPPIRLLGCL